MTKSELIEKITMKLGTLTHPKVEVAVNSILELMRESLGNGQRIEIREFGIFNIKTQQARTVRNPKTGELLENEAKAKVHFKPGKGLKDRVNASA
jgi:integration host factor subunit beta